MIAWRVCLLVFFSSIRRHTRLVGDWSSDVCSSDLHRDAFGNFVDNPGGQLIHARGTDSDIVEHITTAENVRTFRVVISALGDGFVECISNTALQNNVAAQPSGQRGTLTAVPVVEAGNTLRIGRFGWKAQHARSEERRVGKE